MLKKICHVVLPVFLLSSLVGCSVPFNRSHFNHYYSAGMKALEQGDLKGARRNFGRALKNAESGFMNPSVRADVLFHYSRVLGNLCEYQAAEKGFLRARQLSGEIPGDEGRLMRYQINTELGRMNHDAGFYSQAIPYFEEALPLGEGVSGKWDPPPGFSSMLMDYRDALVKTGNGEKAEDVSKKMEASGGEEGRIEAGMESLSTPSGSADRRYPGACIGSGKISKGHKHHEH